ncbi:hypothetical protein [Azospirillum sp. TSO22-1]|uniref:hypothetical protein n=1 Tax=Azospirillum sp. TSO22-1 TaxID=716789 RepID=UPI000D604D2F|nr:hypothetical protein [Azospirillum sp. TSO22-1]PWC44871.1 hypothetical protein TSO221_17160 [Azospirillum sp. TSO22-1]
MSDSNRTLATTVLAPLVLGSLAACTPLVWGGTYHAVEKSPQSITVEYENSLTSRDTVLVYASEHCGRYAKRAALADIDRNPRTELLRFECR